MTRTEGELGYPERSDITDKLCELDSDKGEVGVRYPNNFVDFTLVRPKARDVK